MRAHAPCSCVFGVLCRVGVGRTEFACQLKGHLIVGVALAGNAAINM